MKGSEHMEEKEELQELTHEAWPGYKLAFGVVFAVLVLYFVVIVIAAPDGGFLGSHH